MRESGGARIFAPFERVDLEGNELFDSLVIVVVVGAAHGIARSTKMLSSQRPLPSMLILIPCSSSTLMNSSEVN